jgi:hypothetical protein
MQYIKLILLLAHYNYLLIDMENYRQAGREFPGKICKGPMVDAFNRLTQSSIPAKSEQVLSAIERKGGFGSSTDRFINLIEVESAPGPGQYKEILSSGSPSLSRKGYGGLISKSPRFKRFQYNTLAPGPGSYTQTEIATSAISSVFCKPVHNPASKPTLPIPAPGSYEVQTPSKNIYISSPFKSKTKRGQEVVSSSPPPWNYNIESSFITDNKPSPSFRLPVQARRYPINLYDPHAPVPMENTPGPGDYHNTSLPPLSSKPNGSFTKTDPDRFGNPSKFRKNKETTPGPGSYYSYSLKEKVSVSGAVFMSESEREVIKQPKKQPGPAFYRPTAIPKKKSFHLNSSKVWV